MTEAPVFNAMKARFKAGLKTRILAFGSSNTERIVPGMHWFDVFDLAVHNTYGCIHTCINSGIGGHSSGDLLNRFEDDAAFYRPHMVFITVGGNDSNPERQMKEEQFTANLQKLQSRFSLMGCAVVFQTYYSPIKEQHDPEYMLKFYRFMDIIRQVAAETKSGLIDHLVRWEHIRKNHPEKHLPLMQDAMHVNRRGNMVMGLDIARYFDAKLNIPYANFAYDKEGNNFWDEAIEIQKIMDEDIV
jgi:lysophospholipase L1-like esterase